jgi:hypothetical protein
MKIKIIQPQHRKNHGKLINGELHLKEGICYTPNPLKEIQIDSLFIQTKNKTSI